MRSSKRIFRNTWKVESACGVECPAVFFFFLKVAGNTPTVGGVCCLWTGRSRVVVLCGLETAFSYTRSPACSLLFFVRTWTWQPSFETFTGTEIQPAPRLEPLFEGLLRSVNLSENVMDRSQVRFGRSTRRGNKPRLPKFRPV